MCTALLYQTDGDGWRWQLSGRLEALVELCLLAHDSPERSHDGHSNQQDQEGEVEEAGEEARGWRLWRHDCQNSLLTACLERLLGTIPFCTKGISGNGLCV